MTLGGAHLARQLARQRVYYRLTEDLAHHSHGPALIGIVDATLNERQIRLR